VSESLGGAGHRAYETRPGEQAQFDFGQLTLSIGDKPERAHLVAFTLGFSRRIFTQAFTTNG
jgi:hypothetical protein